MRRSTSTAFWRSASPPRRPLSAIGATAVIAAAGSGQRLGAGGPKAFVPVAGRPMVEWSIEAFRAAGPVRSIVVACPPGHDLDLSGHDLDGHDVAVVAGGETRAQSVSNALEGVETELVAVHDAARPLLTAALVEELVARLAESPDAAGVIAATQVTDTIKSVSTETPSATSAPLTTSAVGNGAFVVTSTLDRVGLWAAQTPQVFRTEALRAALTGDPEGVAAATDEAMLVEAAGGRVLIHPTSAENLKITTPLDLRVAELLLAERASA